MDINSLERFIKAQDHTYDTALRELENGQKESHWMWYIFPQLRGLGYSDTAYIYGIDGIDEAVAYLDHPVLNSRLTECCEALLSHKNKSAENIFGDVDAMKLRSSMTLFATACEEDSIFHEVLDTFFNGDIDERTLELIQETHPSAPFESGRVRVFNGIFRFPCYLITTLQKLHFLIYYIDKQDIYIYRKHGRTI